MNVILRRAGIILGSLVLLLIVVAAGGYYAAERHVTRRYAVENESIAIPADSISIERGRHLARAIAKCADCHTETLGGQVMIDNPALGRFVPLNLTRGKGGLGATLKDADWVRAIRHGVGHDGRALRIMPAREYNNLSAEDVGAIIAYAKSVPPKDNELPPSTLGPVARGLLDAGKLPIFDAEVIDHAKPVRAIAPPAGPTAEYGEYLAHVGGCAGCHAPTFAGGKIEGGDPSWPPAANLTPTGLKAYDEAAFFSVLRTGVRKDGSKLKDPMPWKWTREMTDDETRAIWLYLKTVPPREFGAR